MPTVVEARKTPWKLPDLMAAYHRAAIARNIGLMDEAVLVLCAQSTVECGQGGAACFNFNVSNIMGVSPEGRYHVLQAPECAPAEKVPIGATILASSNVACPPGSVAYIPAGGSKFRAYSSLDAGCADKLATLQKTWPAAVKSLELGGSLAATAGSYVAALTTPRYFSADENKYAALVASIAKGLKATHDIILAQEHLTALGYSLGEADGVVGPKTRAAVSRFQKDHALAVDGMLNDATRRALGLIDQV